jgi:hypothetical protein
MAKVKINNEEYEFVGVDTITLDDAIILYEYSGLTLDQIYEFEGHVHPGLIAAILHVSIARAKPELKKREVREFVGRLELSAFEEMFKDFDETVEEDARPPESPTLSGDDSEMVATSGDVENTPFSGEGSNGTGDNSQAELVRSRSGTDG